MIRFLFPFCLTPKSVAETVKFNFGQHFSTFSPLLWKKKMVFQTLSNVLPCETKFFFQVSMRSDYWFHWALHFPTLFALLNFLVVPRFLNFKWLNEKVPAQLEKIHQQIWKKLNLCFKNIIKSFFYMSLFGKKNPGFWRIYFKIDMEALILSNLLFLRRIVFRCYRWVRWKKKKVYRENSLEVVGGNEN